MGLLWRLAAAAFFQVVLFVGFAELMDPPQLPWAADIGTQFLTLLGVALAHSVGIAALVHASSRRGVGLLGVLALLYLSAAVVFPPVQAELMDLPLPDGAKTDYALIGFAQSLLWLPAASWVLARWADEAPEASSTVRPRWGWVRPFLFGAVFVALRYAAERVVQLQVPEDLVAGLRLETATTSVWVWWLLRGVGVSAMAWLWLRHARGAWLWRGLWLGVGLAAFEVAPMSVHDWPAIALPAALSFTFGVVLALGWRVAPFEVADPEDADFAP